MQLQYIDVVLCKCLCVLNQVFQTEAAYSLLTGVAGCRVIWTQDPKKPTDLARAGYLQEHTELVMKTGFGLYFRNKSQRLQSWCITGPTGTLRKPT